MPPNSRHGTGATLREPGSADQLPLRVRLNPPPYRFTLQVQFTAVHPDLAGAVAATLVLGLGTLCPHVEPDTARVSPVDTPGGTEPVFCAAVGPGGVSCEDLYGHPGWHAEAGVNGRRWER
jgi:hypothetical protein